MINRDCNFEVILLQFVLNNHFKAKKSENGVKEVEMEEIKDEVHELQDAEQDEEDEEDEKES